MVGEYTIPSGTTIGRDDADLIALNPANSPEDISCAVDASLGIAGAADAADAADAGGIIVNAEL
jgi:hypothetical protein